MRREPHIPPAKHLHKMRRRLEYVQDAGHYELLRPGDAPPRPPKRELRQFMEQHDLLMRDLERLLDDLDFD